MKLTKLPVHTNCPMKKNLICLFVLGLMLIRLTPNLPAQRIADTLDIGEITLEMVESRLAQALSGKENAGSVQKGSVEVISDSAAVNLIRGWAIGDVPSMEIFAERLASSEPGVLEAAIQTLDPANDHKEINSMLWELSSFYLGAGWTDSPELVKLLRLHVQNPKYEERAFMAWGKIEPARVHEILEAKVEEGSLEMSSYYSILNEIPPFPMLTERRLEFWKNLLPLAFAVEEEQKRIVAVRNILTRFEHSIEFEDEKVKADFLQWMKSIRDDLEEVREQGTWGLAVLSNKEIFGKEFIASLEPIFRPGGYADGPFRLGMIGVEESPATRRKLYLKYIEQLFVIEIPEPARIEFEGFEEELLKKLAELFESGKFSSTLHAVSVVRDFGGMAAVQTTADLIGTPQKQAEFRRIAEEAYGPLNDAHPLMERLAAYQKSGLVCLPLKMALADTARREALRYEKDYDHAARQIIPNFIQFDRETIFFPNPYDELILREFVPAACGKLEGLKVLMLHDYEDYRYPEIKVWVVFRDKAYLFEPRGESGWLNEEAVQEALNVMLETEGFEERFVRWDTGDQTAGFYFGEPAKTRGMLEQMGYKVP